LSSSISPEKRASIVVLCYNGLEEVTRPCIESLLANTAAADCELILVDNASSDGTPAYLDGLANTYAHVRVQINASNKGYAGGNNDGMRMAGGNHIVLLNNDTLVPPGWLDRLLCLLETRREVGLVSPITNSAGNEQRIDLQGLDESNFELVAGAYTQQQAGHWFTTGKLGFFCVAMRRALIEEIGYLDENFGIGMFEDDDYCIRVQKKGYQLAVVEDCFIYHKGSASFRKLDSADYAQIFNRNRDYFFHKHDKIWAFSDIADAIWEKISADIDALVEPLQTAAIERINARATGMSGALLQLREIETSSYKIDGQSVAEIQLIEKHKQLMAISDWATGLRKNNEQLASELATKHGELMAMSDWASSMKQELDALSASRLYRLIKWMRNRI
jgi:GT2 family glycosyltransferase